MRHLLTICLIAVVGMATTGYAQNALPAPGFPTPAYEVAPPPAALNGAPAPYAYPPPSAAPIAGAPVVYCENIRVKDACNIHPCAVPTLVEVPDPCNRHCTVCIEICAPPCECVCIKRHGLLKRKVRFDYGDYQVDVVSRGGRIVIDYDA